VTLAGIGALLGLLFGFWRAKRAGGNGFDQAQWALVFALIFGLAGLMISVVIVRNL